MKEREISLVDLMVEILLRWRVIIVWMLVGGLVMGGFSYLRSKQSAAQRGEDGEYDVYEEGLVLLEETLTSTQKHNVWTALYYEESKEYFNNSLLTQMEAASVPKTELFFWVKANDFEQSYNIKRLYELALINGMAVWMAENDLNQNVNLSELVTVTSKDAETGSNSFIVQIIHVTEEACADLADQVEAYIDFLHAKFSTEIEEHDIILIDRSFANVMDISLLSRQQTIITTITSFNANVDRLMQDFSEAEQIYYNLLKTGKISEEDVSEEEDFLQQSDEETVSASKGSVSVKYILLGMVLFAFLYVFYLFMQYVLNNRLRASDDIDEIYDLPQLGNIPQIAPPRKFLGVVDDWILKLRNGNKRVFAEEEAIGLAAVAVKIAVKKEDMDKVFCIGCDMKGRTQKVAEQLQMILKEENITMDILSNVLYDQEALEQLSSAKCAFLLETAGGTFYGEIAKELELLKRQDIKVIGGIIME